MRTRTFLRLCAVTALTAAILLASAGIALAAPGEPTLGLTELQARLDASAASGTPLMGYLKTVLKGSKIETIQVEVLALTGEPSESPLIMFEAQGAQIDKFGGIVAGMSGSPIYVEDGGVDKVIGALSYGDIFTLSGTGLATPIESMLRIVTDYAPQVQELSSPVLTSGRVIDRVIVSSHPETLKAASQSGAFVAKPLSSMYIGGLRPTSRLYKNLKKRIEGHGMSVVQLDSALSAGASTFSTDLVPGAAVAALESRGDLWLGGMGTVTYTDDDSLLAFGHPMSYVGDTSLYMANAVVSGVWPSSYWPYKIGYPATIRGTFTQDRLAGIFGTVGGLPDETPITAHAVNVSNGAEADSSVHFSSGLLDRGELSYAVSYAASVAGYKLFDAASTPGSALTTTTVVVGVGSEVYEVKITNMIDDAYDIPSSVAYDVDNSVYSLLSVLDDGIEKPHIVSVRLESAISPQRRFANIVSVTPKKALKVGDNGIEVKLLAYGVVATQTIETTLTIPEGTPLMGTLTASSVYADSSEYSELMEMYLGGQDLSFPDSYTRQTVSQIVDDLNATNPGNTVFVSFEPDPTLLDSVNPDAEPVPPSVGTTVSIDTSATADWVVRGSARLHAPAITVEVYPSPVSYDGFAMISGVIVGFEDDTTVTVYVTPYGGVETAVEFEEPVIATYDEDMGGLFYEAPLWDLESNAKVRVEIEGTSGHAPAEATADVKVRALVLVSSSSKSVRYGRTVTLSAKVKPGTSRGTKVSFQYYDTKTRKWRTIGSAKVLLAGSAGYAKASTKWKPLKGAHKVRVLFAGNARNVSTASGSVTISAR